MEAARKKELLRILDNLKKWVEEDRVDKASLYHKWEGENDTRTTTLTLIIPAEKDPRRSTQ